MKEIFWELEPGGLAYPIRTAKMAVFGGVFGDHADPSQDVKLTGRLILKWRHRIERLHEVGWTPGERVLTKARNCYPSTAKVANAVKPNYCNLWFCPFCWARRVEDIYHRVVPSLRHDRFGLGGFYHYVLRRSKCISIIDGTEDNPVHKPYRLLRTAALRRTRLMRWAKPIGLVSLATVEPALRPFGCKLIQRQLMVVKPSCYLPRHKVPGVLRFREGFADGEKGFASRLWRLLRYPRLYLYAPAELMHTVILAHDSGNRSRLFATAGWFSKPTSERFRKILAEQPPPTY